MKILNNIFESIRSVWSTEKVVDGEKFEFSQEKCFIQPKRQ